MRAVAPGADDHMITGSISGNGAVVAETPSDHRGVGDPRVADEVVGVEQVELAVGDVKCGCHTQRNAGLGAMCAPGKVPLSRDDAQNLAARAFCLT
jgi:hypothetical protein